MMTSHWASLAAAVSLALAGLSSCGIFTTSGPRCSPSTCGGCCDPAGVCQTGITPAACGLRGTSCAVCLGQTPCAGGQCVNGGVGGGTGAGVGGGSGGGAGCAGCIASNGQCVLPPNNAFNSVCGASGQACSDCTASGKVCTGFTCAPPTACSAATCAGCCTSAGVCVLAPNNLNNTTCGRGGATCVSCVASSQICDPSSAVCAPMPQPCDGCRLSSGACVPQGSTSVTSCGSGGGACRSCGTNERCELGTCVTLGPTITPGAIGSPCAADRECNAVPLSNGGKAYCKKRMLPGSLNYRGGYCTRYCTTEADCGGGTSAHCSYWLGDTGELEPLCYRDCSASPCRAGYGCVDLGGPSEPRPSCLPVQADGGLGTYDAGPPNPGTAGAACTSEAQCGGSSFQCIPERTDAGATGYTGGMCSGDCTMSLVDAFCGRGGACVPTLSDENPSGYGELVFWTCWQRCDPSAASTCREGYVCMPSGGSATQGRCTPDCRVAESLGARVCTGMCSQSTGLCQ